MITMALMLRTCCHVTIGYPTPGSTAPETDSGHSREYSAKTSGCTKLPGEDDV
ncbi:hypothetical protein LHJ74_11610 [Streptomyces sp. N2-109]|uniref:Uncharacterized protein n=1 Tax=Streptomyces gossypii TaxID=2883101 RepID=A0ABT2JS14_9ACTN|nr:hypothetical protein [Streptomyces gossypii]MCT2590546.1 hypothetical protein [Streptomyces gossypii]